MAADAPNAVRPHRQQPPLALRKNRKALAGFLLCAILIDYAESIPITAHFKKIARAGGGVEDGARESPDAVFHDDCNARGGQDLGGGRYARVECAGYFVQHLSFVRAAWNGDHEKSRRTP